MRLPRHVRNTAFYLIAAIPLLFILFVAGPFDERDVAVFDAIFLRVLAVIAVVLLWRGVLALEALTRGSSAPIDKP